MDLALWIVSALVGAVFLFSGVTKGTWSKDRLLAAGQTGVGPVPLPLLRTVATAELLGVAGLFLPWLTGIAPALTPVAAAGLGVVLVGATAIHLRLGEPRTALATLGLLGLCGVLAVGRWGQL